jgi:hypothetical protein
MPMMKSYNNQPAMPAINRKVMLGYNGIQSTGCEEATTQEGAAVEFAHEELY